MKNWRKRNVIMIILCYHHSINMTFTSRTDLHLSLGTGEPIYVGGVKNKQPEGSLGDLGPSGHVSTGPKWIAPLNTDIVFSEVHPFQISAHSGLMAINPAEIPTTFNWRDDGPPDISRNIAPPGNQLLCGSCWAMSCAGVVGDVHVVSKVVKWRPSLSTTYSLACYPQERCKGGSPAKLLTDISRNGLMSNACIGYGWCKNNDQCNGTATKHFKASAETDISSSIPECGCISASEHYLYKSSLPLSMSIGEGGLTQDNFALTVKKHIRTQGPVVVGFLVFKNFMHGTHAHPDLNNGVYLENGSYNKDGKIVFNPEQTSAREFVGSHAVAVIGWGVAKGTVIDNKGTKRDVPYWLARNSWGQKWGDKGYFKMAMYPFNKTSQFDMKVRIQRGMGVVLGGWNAGDYGGASTYRC